MPEDIICFRCGVRVSKRLSNIVDGKTGRPFKHIFCSQDCYNRWRKDEHLRVKAEWLRFQREVWGTSGDRRQCEDAKKRGRFAEIIARDKHLPAQGFTEIVDMSGYSNQFFIDYVATFEGKRVLVDATIKLKAYIPDKIRLARILKMPLYIIHVSILNHDVFYLHEVPAPNNSIVRVPATFIRELALLKGID